MNFHTEQKINSFGFINNLKIKIKIN